MRKEGNVLFKDALNTSYLRLYGIGHMVKDHSYSEKGRKRFIKRRSQHILFTVIWHWTYGEGPFI